MFPSPFSQVPHHSDSPTPHHSNLIFPSPETRGLVDGRKKTTRLIAAAYSFFFIPYSGSPCLPVTLLQIPMNKMKKEVE
jgi:hypothetical protein